MSPVSRLKKIGIYLVLLACLVLSACVIRHGLNTGEPPPATPVPTVLDEPGEFTVATLESKMKNRKGTFPLTVYYPADSTGSTPAVAFSPGLAAHKDKYVWVGRHLASHGYTVLIFTVPNRFSLRTVQHEAGFDSAFEFLAAENANPAGPLHNRVDMSRRVIMGHSLGGLAGLRKAAAMDNLAAVVVFAPAPGMKEDKLLSVTAPTQIQAASFDCITGEKRSRLYYQSLAADAREIIDIAGGNHVGFNDEDSIFMGKLFDCRAAIGIPDHQQRLSRRYFTAWLDYYVKGDETVTPYLFGENAEEDLKSGVLTDWEFVRP